jgi:PAS domain S-box-containing protein
MACEQPFEASTVAVLHAAVEAFRKREITYRDILEDLPVAIYTTDIDGLVTYYNRECVALSGRQPVLGDDRWSVAWKLYTPSGEALAHSESPTAGALRDCRPVRGVEIVVERPDGSRVDCLPFPTPIFDPAGDCIGAVTMLVDVTEQKLANERAILLAREVDHRSTNLLTVVQSLIRLTKADSLEAYREAVEARLTALGRANRLVADARWKNVSLRSLVDVELDAFSSQVEVTGDPIELRPQSAQYLGMLVHELCTNAVKYGALSVESGSVSLGWAIDDSGILMLTWQERGGPPVTEPSRKNIGNAVILGVARQLKGEIFRDWRPEGLRCTLLCSRDRL